jgi:predicted metal-dependent enzyme (double-stranded beta helix superfamily)
MSQTIKSFAKECRDILTNGSSDESLDQVRLVTEKYLADDGFVTTHLGPNNTVKRTVLYEDPDIGFCICAHVYKGVNEAPPHDHGNTWAIYGQATGITVMTEYDKLQEPEGDQPGKVKPVKFYDLAPGMAVVYPTGRLHSPRRDGDTRLIRIEGKDLMTVSRESYEAA